MKPIILLVMLATWIGPAVAQPPPDEPAATTPTAEELRSAESFGADYRLLRALGEITLVNLVQNAWGRYIFTEGSEGFIVSWDSIKENLQAGMNWDDNSFSANNFRHPYQGGFYYNAGRSNQFNFYESSLLAFAGSWSWEYLGENHNASFNDWVNTAVGGVAVGEIQYRLASLVLDNTATGWGRFWRELGGTAINPIRGVNRLLTGEATNVHANPADRFPSHWRNTLTAGGRVIGDQHVWHAPSSKVFVAYQGVYGDGFEKYESPFDHFEVGTQLTFNNKPHGIERLESRGRLGSRTVNSQERTQHVLASYLHFDYIDNEVTTFGGQSLGASFLSRLGGRDELSAEATLDVNAILLGATKSDYFNISGRNYDYGPGFGVKFMTRVSHRGWDIATVAHDSYVIHSVNGGAVDSWVSFTRARLDVPVRKSMGLGIEWILYHSERAYPDLSHVRVSDPELRLHAVWSLH